ncbi:hypothetical protein [Domibacillus enclensis]|uniref:Uncharacterized protein n=1 Tax=Domibacillus enclensis TaxID=1017273 RepID=A0A1N6WI91_9BACI|nr:hypothetical protein [Domibacillus enclensis]OXS77940.1 hypothetical protein B1B05_10060 [Domibacillus enclensis]SIQ89732.1 hypothetical protein SAMN05443094_104174 [Domibacillus enclensis]
MKTMKEQLVVWCKVNNVPKPAKPKKRHKKKQPVRQSEKLTERDMKYLMNTNMQTLRRGKGGAYK